LCILHYFGNQEKMGFVEYGLQAIGTGCGAGTSDKHVMLM
jgi:hypothetical protein